MTDHTNEAPAKLITSAEVEEMRASINRADGRMSIISTSPMGVEYTIVSIPREVLSEIFDLAAMAARIRER